MKKGFTPSPKGAQCFSQRSETMGFKEVNKYFSLEQGLSGKTAKRCSAPLVRGFTLIELLIVIGILAILATATVLVLNPAQLFAQARDSQRVSDLATLRSAISFYLATVSSPSVGSTTNCYPSLDSTVTIPANCNGRHAATRLTLQVTAANLLNINATGWLPVDFSNVPGGSPLSVLPVDPTNSTTYFYSYAADNTAKTFELNANMESSRYEQGGPDDVESTDGGDQAGLYEAGNDPGLNL